MQQNAQLQNAQCYKTPNVTKHPMQEKVQNSKKTPEFRKTIKIPKSRKKCYCIFNCII